jgi:hypothetical protein
LEAGVRVKTPGQKLAEELAQGLLTRHPEDAAPLLGRFDAARLAEFLKAAPESFLASATAALPPDTLREILETGEDALLETLGAFDECVFVTPHRADRDGAALDAHGLPIRLVPGLVRGRDFDLGVAQHVVQRGPSDSGGRVALLKACDDLAYFAAAVIRGTRDFQIRIRREHVLVGVGIERIECGHVTRNQRFDLGFVLEALEDVGIGAINRRAQHRPADRKHRS